MGSLHASAAAALRPRTAQRGPLSHGQQRLWFLDRWLAGRPVFTMPVVLRLTGPLDAGRLIGALRAVADRHDVLFTVFEEGPDGPRQRVLASRDLPCPVTDLSTAGEGAARALIDQDARRPFDLAAGPMVRAHLFRLGAETHWLQLTFHHIAFDGWSFGVFQRQLAEAYRAGADPGEPLEVQYADYALWQRETLTGEATDRALQAWTRALAGAPDVLDLGADRPRPAELSYRGRTDRFALPGIPVTALEKFAAGEGVTPYVALLASFQALVARHAGRDDIVLGSPTAGRGPAALDEMVGFFADSLVIRTTLDGDPTFRQLVTRTRAGVLDALSRSRVPFDLAVNHLRPARDLSFNPVVQVVFGLHEEDAAETLADGVGIERTAVDTGTAKYDLTWSVYRGANGLRLDVEYATDLFDAATVRTFVSHWETLLQGVVADPDVPLSRIELASGDEAERLRRWAGQERPSPTGTVHDLVARAAAARPDAVAITCAGETLTYAELDRRSTALARRLRAMGVRPEDCVGVCMTRSPEMVVACLAILRAGGVYVPLDTAFPADRMAFMLREVGAGIVLVHPPTAGVVPDGPWRVAGVGELDDEGTDADALPEVGPGNGCYVIFTSGSTGRPKGTTVTHGNVLGLLDGVRERLPFGPDDVWTFFHSFAFDFSVWEVWGALTTGGRLVVVPYDVSRDADAFHRLVRDERVTILSQTPSAFRQFETADDQAGGELSLRAVVFGGEALHRPSVRRWAARHGYDVPLLVNMYGITETTVHVTYLALVEDDLDRDLTQIGQPLPGVVAQVLDRYGRPCPIGVTGEIHVGGAGLARGYTGRPGLTAERFGPDDRTGRPGRRLYRTGDLGRWNTRGGLEYAGRADSQVKVRGYRIETGEIEAVLGQHPRLLETAVIARAGADGQVDLAGYLVADGAAPTPDELREWLRRRLPDYMVPRHFVVLDVLPLTPQGKVDRRALPAPEAVRPELAQEYVPPQGPVEELLAEIWGEVLAVDRVGRHDNFFDLGGDSIRSIGVLGRARSNGLAFDLQDLFRSPTPAGLAELVRTAAPVAAADREPFAMLADRDRALLPDGVEDAYPMAELQVGMVYEMELNPERRAYHNLDGLRIVGPFDEERFREATARVVARHPILRTAFDLSGFSEPMQLVYSAAEMPFTVVDLRHLDEAARDEALDAYVLAERRRPFDHSRPLLLRFALHRLTDESFQWTLTEHHAIFDGWSLHSTISEIAEVYQRLLAGEDPVLTPPDSAYRDFIAAEREVLASEESRRFWLDRVGDRPDCRLPRRPADRPELVSGRAQPHEWRAHYPDQGYGAVETLLPEDLCDGLRDLARRCAVPLKAVLLAAHLKVMSLVTGTSDLLVGLTANGRLEEEGGAEVRGMFLNTVPFRIALPDGSWRDLIRAVFETERELLPHRRYPLGALQREVGGDPLFEVNFVHNHFHVLDRAFGPGLMRIEDGKIDSFATDRVEPTNFPLNVGMVRNPYSNRLLFGMDYHTDVLTPDQVLLYRDYYVRAMTEMVADPEAAHRSVPLLGEDERALLDSWNSLTADVPPTPVHRMVEARAAAAPHAVAVESGGTALTYRELNARANRAARRLRDLGVGPDVPVALCMDRSIATVTCLLAVLKAGGVYVPIEPDYPAERVEYMLTQTGAPLVLTTGGAVPEGPWQQLVADDGLWTDGDGGNLPGGAGPDHGCYVIFTSGSTGQPKGVVTRHRNVTELLHGGDFLTLGPTDTLLQLAPLSFDNSTFEVWAPLVGGARLVLAPAERYGPAEIAEWVAAAGVTVLHATASLFALLVDHEPATFDGLRRFLTGSETVSPGHVTRILQRCPDLELVNCWGPTETTTFSVCGVYRRGSVPAGALPLGSPLVNTQVWVLDEAGLPVPVGSAGELYVSGPCLARGYLGRPGLTAERFVPHPFRAGERLYRTGDRGRWSVDGLVEFLGRTDHMVKVRGYRVELGEVEAALREHPGIRECVVVTRPDGAAGVDLVGYLVADGGGLSSGEVRSWLGARLPAYMVPRLFVFLDALPLTPRAKVDRRALPEPEPVRPDVGQEYEAPQGPVEELLAEIWCRVLRVDRVGRHDNFFDLGGDSIRNIQLVGHARANGLTVGLQDLHRHPTVASLAEAVQPRGSVPKRARTSAFDLLSDCDRERLSARGPGGDAR
ncbi:non-ribosomal peptide synthetase [Paractinoplanes brasiliensis]|uniref:Amino acid adenylation domain-containing protein n=1 Tax=Paractinoplanes brasiliensis TaxID=52695 RepID=A0A4R6JPN3_9ACTN|nr:non-ribosomal peptide synthetase [Actinoplanes brasiliensis]TDO36766.1 amino acid adenylation domain-containing protein [Actinoplanes brasiliensis]GID30283.1 non-ribosomal peptide synthetase [Actinoplanes brasiliensis]